LAGLLLIAAFLTILLFREKLFRIVFERGWMGRWPRCSTSTENWRARTARTPASSSTPSGWRASLPSRHSRSPASSATPEVISLFLRLGDLTDDDKLLAAAILFVYRTPEELAQLEPRFDPRIWRRVENSKAWEPAKRLLLTSWRAMFRIRADAAARSGSSIRHAPAARSSSP
jgi:hypothetical protein